MPDTTQPPLFASFHTTDSTSRLDFQRLLCQPEERYTLNKKMLTRCKQLSRWRIKGRKHRTLVCEAALYGTLLTEPWHNDLAWSAMTRRSSSCSGSSTGCAGCTPNARSRG